MGFVLSPIAIILMAFLSLFHDVWMMIYDVYKRHWLQVVSEREFKKAKRIDILANWLFGDLLNFCFSSRNETGYKFGVFGETISSCLGVKKLEKTLNWAGLFLYWFLYIIDISAYKKGGHCFYAIQTQEEIEEFILVK